MRILKTALKILVVFILLSFVVSKLDRDLYTKKNKRFLLEAGVSPYWISFKYLGFDQAATVIELLKFYYKFYYIHVHFVHHHHHHHGEIEEVEMKPEDYDKAMKWLKNFAFSLTDLDPYNEELYFYLGYIIPDRNQLDLILPLMAQATGYLKSYKPYEWLMWIGLLYLKNPKFALVFAQRAVNKFNNLPPRIYSMAAFISEYLGHTEKSVKILEKLLKEDNEKLLLHKHRYQLFQKHFLRLKQQFLIQTAVEVFYKKYHFYPKKLKELVDKKILAKIPDDPFNLGFYIENGKVRWKGTAEKFLKILLRKPKKLKK